MGRSPVSSTASRSRCAKRIDADWNAERLAAAPRAGIAVLAPVNEDGLDDATLLAAIANGDGAAFHVLVRRHVRAATLLAVQFVGDYDAAEDVVQVAFVKVFEKAPTLDVSRAFAPWFFAIVRRLAMNARARDRRRARLWRKWGTTVAEPSVPGVEGAVDGRFDTAVVQRAMAGLSPMQRACFELVALRDISPKAVAAMHGITESTVRQHVFRARAALREVLDLAASDDAT